MDWRLRLLDYAKEAEDTAAGLGAFVSEIPQYRKDITGDIAELYAISNALQTLQEAVEHPCLGRASGRILKDLEICLPSLGYTLDDVRDMFSKSKRKRRLPGAFPGTPQYAEMWEDALADFKTQGISLSNRLEYYRTYLQGMYDELRDIDPGEEIDRIEVRLEKLLKQQEPLDSYLSRLKIPSHSPVMTPGPKPPRNPRPNIKSFTSYPTYSYGPAPPPPPPSRTPRPVPQIYAGIGEVPMGGFFVPPAAPSVPTSPTFSSASSQGMSSHSTDSGGPVAHWAMRIFDGRHPSTPFRTLGDATECAGRDEPNVIQMLGDDHFEKVLELPLEATNVWLRLYCRYEDLRARILFLTMDSDGTRRRYCFPLTGLKIIRKDSCLQMCRVNRKDGRLDLWARLRFPLYERMILFYNTAVAMKHQDQARMADGLEDIFDRDRTERLEFSSEISDSHFLHHLRVYHDMDSGVVRFEATPRRGPLKDVPIWTAFVTHFVGDRSWMKKVGSTTVVFRQLHPYVFCEGYKVPKALNGRHQLNFSSSQDARDLIDIFHQIKVRR
ncbi:uncharacterized protein M421DRAFT_54036 [Didymella exigua CBS 183.55]|uniref:Uncharacterized protein n=1 Tax=Didymella exigua CBS 183.55 TaxID=1150837 RepID=A0A6A5RWY0_9PLEO|nr:uncharacterized protein M421DRAFT_54036 [Didymella exigua CBS 183.55]KAF1932911.1 hypothetical protein M421DRAFT_54036 [Didymella exigua CBS 183.55]